MATATASELTGVVSLDLRREPDFPLDSRNMEAAARALQVVDEESYALAARIIQRNASWVSKIEAFFEDDRSLANKLHKSITTKIAKLTAPGRVVRPILEPKMLAFRRKQEDEKRAIETARLLREQAERRRAEDEARAIQAKGDADAAELRRQGEFRSARAITALAAEEAKTVIAEAVPLAVIPTDTRPQAEGVNDRRPWVGRLVSEADLILGVAAGLPNEFNTTILELVKFLETGPKNEFASAWIKELKRYRGLATPLMHTIPVKTRQSDGKLRDVDTSVPILEVNQAVPNYIAKRLGMEDIGIPGVKGERELGLSFRRTDDPGPQEPDTW